MIVIENLRRLAEQKIDIEEVGPDSGPRQPSNCLWNDLGCPGGQPSSLRGVRGYVYAGGRMGNVQVVGRVNALVSTSVVVVVVVV